MIILRFNNSKDLGNICYQTGNWFQEVYIDSDIVESTVKDIDIVSVVNGEEVLDEAITQEVNSLKFIGHHFMWRALKNIRMHSFIELTLDNGERIYPKNVKVKNPEWVSLGEAAIIEINFTIETTIKRNTIRNMK